jgi:5-methylthioribose kinase
MNFDIEQADALLRYLRETGRIGVNEQSSIRNLAGGVSNRTVLVERPSGEAWVIKQALEKLRVAVDWFSSPERIHREALGLRWLAELAPEGTITPLIFEDFEHHLLAMAAVPQPHENWKTMLLHEEIDSDHVRQFGELLGVIHARAAHRRDELAPIFDDRSFFESLRLEPYYAYTTTQVSQAADFLNTLIEETRANRITLVHGDYSPKNVLVYNNQLVLLDHEVIHWGDPAFDVGFSMTHLLSKAHHVTIKRPVFALAAELYWKTYLRSAGEQTFELGGTAWVRQIEARAVRHTLACLLARVAGRSPLEYLSAAERERQRKVVLALMQNPPDSMNELIERFIARLG